MTRTCKFSRRRCGALELAARHGYRRPSDLGLFVETAGGVSSADDIAVVAPVAFRTGTSRRCNKRDSRPGIRFAKSVTLTLPATRY